MRLLFVVSTLRRTGPTSQLLNMTNTLRERGHEVRVLTLSPEPDDTMAGAFDDRNVDRRSLEMSRWQGWFMSRRHLCHEIDRWQPDVLHSQGIRADLLSARIERPHARVATLRNVPFEDYPDTYGPVLGHAMARLHLRALNGISEVAVVSQSAQVRLADRLTARVVPNGVDRQRFYPPSIAEMAAARQRLGIDDEETLIVSTGSLSMLKDPHTLIEAVKRMPRQMQVRLIIVGDGPIRADCEAAASDNISLVGAVTDVRPYLWAGNLFTSASRSEGMPNAVLEALSSGLPVALSDIGAHRDILAINGSAGETFRVGNVDDCADMLTKVAQTAGRRREAIEELADHFSAKANARAYEELYATMVADHASAIV